MSEFTSNFNRKKLGKIFLTAPGPSATQMFSYFISARKDPAGFLVEMRKKYGNVVQFPLPILPVYLVTHPDDVDRVMRVNAKNYGKRTIQYENLALVTGDGLLAADTNSWKRQRKLIQPAFHHEAVMRVGPDTVAVTNRMLEKWEKLAPNSIIDIDDDMMHSALEIVGKSLFGTDLSGDVEKTAQATIDALDIIVARARTPITFPKWIPTRNNRKLAKSLKQLDSAVQRILDERKKISGIAGVDRQVDMLDLLLATQDEEGGLDSKELRDQIVTFIVAGHETVASSLTWTWWLLGDNQEVQKLLQKEVDEVLNGKEPTVKDIEKLPYTRAIVDEALRIYPPGWVVSRRSLDSDVLGGFEIPEKSVVIISPWATHRHPDSWVDAEKFDPQRFMPNAPTPPKGTYLPFGIGPRMCIGKDFAILESMIMIARIAQHWTITPAGGKPVPRALVMVRPAGGLPMYLNKRS